MSTGTIAPPEKQQEWWEEADVFEEIEESSQFPVKRDVSRRSAVGLIEDALDLAVKEGLAWDKRRAIDAIVTSHLGRATETQTQANALNLLERWERETSRFGSIYAAKSGDTYERLSRLNPEVVIRAALERLTRSSSMHMLTLLGDIAGAAPAADETTVNGASQAWLTWGKRQGMI